MANRPRITLVAARAINGIIGRDGTLPWHIPADLKRFKALTMGSAMIMNYKVAGFANGGADKMAPLVDRVLGGMVSRFSAYATPPRAAR